MDFKDSPPSKQLTLNEEPTGMSHKDDMELFVQLNRQLLTKQLIQSTRGRLDSSLPCSRALTDITAPEKMMLNCQPGLS